LVVGLLLAIFIGRRGTVIARRLKELLAMELIGEGIARVLAPPRYLFALAV